MTADRRDGKDQSPMLQWLRENPRLDSIKCSLSITDIDICNHKFVRISSRRGADTPEYLMLLETKTHGAELKFAQRDTLDVLDLMLRKLGTDLIEIQDKQKPQRFRYIKYCGFHVLKMSGDSPINSEKMTWDGEAINIQTLEALLRFERDPYAPSLVKELDEAA